MSAQGYLLDTCIISAMARNPLGPIYSRIETLLSCDPALDICTSVVVTSEIQFGLKKGVSRKTASAVDVILRQLAIKAFDQPADKVYGEIRADLQKAGTPIGGNDLLIAAHAKHLGYTLVTDNVREFERVPGLSIENWVR